jgi:hypothetical protein
VAEWAKLAGFAKAHPAGDEASGIRRRGKREGYPACCIEFYAAVIPLVWADRDRWRLRVYATRQRYGTAEGTSGKPRGSLGLDGTGLAQASPAITSCPRGDAARERRPYRYASASRGLGRQAVGSVRHEASTGTKPMDELAGHGRRKSGRDFELRTRYGDTARTPSRPPAWS